MVLSDQDLRELIASGKLVIDPFLPDNIKSAHIDLRLSSILLKYVGTVDLKGENQTEELDIPDKGLTLPPGEFVLGATVESVTIPNGYFGFIETKGNVARAGIQGHNADGHIDPGFSGTVTLEIKNNGTTPVVIYPDMPFVQLFIFKLLSESTRPYNGKYQNQRGPTKYLS